MTVVRFGTGCPRFAGDEGYNFDHDDFADEFQRKRHTADASHQSRYALNHWEIGNHDAQQLRPSGVVFSSAGSGNNCTSNMFGNDEWKERLQKWKVRQEKRSLISKDDLGGNKDNGEEDDFL
ncbi:hypothetical protein SAY87_031752 [Trapa incisa]|uniref:Uncharacterized protein n=1 Tax=Trapa incisa TaxID=236973 RepID=A0AAN7KWK2_9MYRT|nr:hypothetical protein SAY87_031752 [Trapa incisa]